MQPSEIFGFLFDIGSDVMGTVLDKATGVVSAVLGNSTTQKATSHNAEWWQHAGFSSRPATPTQGGSSCQGLALKRSDRDIIFATRDTRGTAIYGNLADGETCVYASAGQALESFKKDGSVRQMTTDDNTPTGNVVFAGISPYWQSPMGPQTGGEWRYYGPWGGAWHDGSGYHLRTYHGVKVDAGGIVLPAPIGLKGSTYSLTADIVSLDAAMLALGRDNGTAQALVQALALQTALLNVTVAISSLAAVVSGFSGTGTFPGMAAFLAPGGPMLTATAAVNSITTACATRAVTGT